MADCLPHMTHLVHRISSSPVAVGNGEMFLFFDLLERMFV